MLAALGAMTLFGISIWSIVFLAIVALIAAVSVANESGLGSLISFGIAMIGLSVFFDVNLWTLISGNFGWTFILCIAYIISGVAYTALWEFPTQMRERYSDRLGIAMINWKEANPTLDESKFYTSRFSNEMHPSNHVDLITRSIFNWPLILLVELLHRPFVWLWKTTYDIFAGMFERIATRVAKSVLNKD